MTNVRVRVNRRVPRPVEAQAMAPTQDALYRELDLDLSWSERDLPERERTKHVHRLHPYLGKFVPQLVEAMLERHLPRREDDPRPVRGLRDDARPVARERPRRDRGRRGRVQLPAYARQDGGSTTSSRSSTSCAIRSAASTRSTARGLRGRTAYLDAWYAPQAAAELVFYRSLVDDYEHADVMRVVLTRAARSARRTTHFDLDFPREPQVGEYWCHKHRRDLPARRAGRAFPAPIRDRHARTDPRLLPRARAWPRSRRSLHGDARDARARRPVRRGRHIAALSGADRLPRAAPLRVRAARARRSSRRGARRGGAGTSAKAIADYVEGIAAVFANAARVATAAGARRDRHQRPPRALPEILDRAGLTIETRYRRHVNRRTGRRAGEFFEDVIVARASRAAARAGVSAAASSTL